MHTYARGLDFVLSCIKDCIVRYYLKAKAVLDVACCRGLINVPRRVGKRKLWDMKTIMSALGVLWD